MCFDMCLINGHKEAGIMEENSAVRTVQRVPL